MITSPDGSRLLNNQWGGLFDAQGNMWNVGNGLIHENGVQPSYSTNVPEPDYLSGHIWQENAAGRWWYWDGHIWQGGDAGFPSSPRAAPYPPSFNECLGGNFNDNSSWTYGTPANYSNQYVEIKSTSTFVPADQWLDGFNLYLNNGSMMLSPGDMFGSLLTVQATMVPADEIGKNLSSTITQAAGTTTSWAHIDVAGPIELNAGSETLNLSIHSGAFINNGELAAYGAHSLFKITAHNQYPGFSGSLTNNGAIELHQGKMAIDAPIHGNGPVDVLSGSTLKLSGPDDGGTFNLAGSSVLEFDKPTPSLQFLGQTVPANVPAMQFGGTIALYDLSEQVKLDGVQGFFDTVTHPSASVTHLTVEDASHNPIASLNFAGTLSDAAFTMTRSGGDTLIGYGHAWS